jgi:hypothetical protein
MADTETCPQPYRDPTPEEHTACRLRCYIQTFDEIEVQLLSAHRSLRGLLALMHASNDEPGHTIRTRDICALLEPIADQVSQASWTACHFQAEEGRYNEDADPPRVQ